MRMKSKVYDILKPVCQVILPALETFWLTLGAIWNFPCYEAVGATIAAVTVFLGAMLKISTDRYYIDKLVSEDEFGREGGDGK